jgi:hypothetical protein
MRGSDHDDTRDRTATGRDGVGTMTTHPSPEEARRQLQAASNASVGSRRDATVHGLATAGLGVLVGAYVAVSEVIDGRGPWDHLALAGYAVLLVALCLVPRGTRSRPRHTRTAVRRASVPTVLLAFAAIFVMNAWGHTVPVAPGYLVLAAAVVAAPMVAAGATIVRGSRR